MMDIDFPEQYAFLFKPRRNKVAFSGRGAGKSYAFALALLLLGLQSKLKILCVREFQTSIKDSVYALLLELNETHKLGYEFTTNEIHHPTIGTTFVFYGLARNVDSIKSLASIDICWVEEASTVSQKSLDKLIPTIRKDNSELWFSFNPDSEHDAVYKMFVTPYKDNLINNRVYADQQNHILFTNYKNNRYLSKTLLKDIDKMKKTNYKKYLHIYGGNVATASVNCIIQPEHFDAVIDAHKKLNIKICGDRVTGFDPASEGQDSKASTSRHGILITSLNQWYDGDLEDAVDKVYENSIHDNINMVVYDGIGLGAGVSIKFKQLDPSKKIAIHAFIGSNSPDNPLKEYADDMTNKAMFRNKRAQYYWLLADRFNATYRAVVHGEYIESSKLISISSDCEYIDELKEELCRIQRVPSSSSSQIQIMSKADMKKLGIASPGLADSLMYCFANPIMINKLVQNININYTSQW